MIPLLVLACSTPPQTFPVKGEIVEVRPPDRVVVAHEAIPGFMDAMTMPFQVSSVGELAVGDQIQGELVVGDGQSQLRNIEVLAHRPPETSAAFQPGRSVPVGTLFPATEVQLAQGSSVTIGSGQEGTWAVTFFYTQCPLPEYCPRVVGRMAELQRALPSRARILAITLDPANDSRGVLREFAHEHGAVPGRWDFGRVPDEVLVGLAEKAGLKTAGGGKLQVTHDLVLLVLDREGRLIERYTDMNWNTDEVVRLLGQ